MPSVPQVLRREINQAVFAPSAPTISPKTACKSISNGVSKLSEMEETKTIWRNCDAVCFDVDSTVCMDEAIDEVAKFCGKEKEVSQITRTAMSGKMDFRTALRTRLSIIRPTLQQITMYNETHPPQLTPGINALIWKLHDRNIPVYLISGGFQSIILPVAEELGIPNDHVHANRLKFYADGEYAGFDEDEPVSRAGGKAEVVSFLKEKHSYKKLVMIGDGATDLQTCPPADAFIGFGGNQVREEVKKGAKWYVYSFQELIDELTLVNGKAQTNS